MKEAQQTTAVRTSTGRVKPQRSREENRERAFLAASRRTDRPLRDRYESALRASAMHKQRTGRSLRVTMEMVEKDEMYEEVDESLTKEYLRLTADLRAEAAVLSQQLQHKYFEALYSQQKTPSGITQNSISAMPGDNVQSPQWSDRSDHRIEELSYFNSPDIPSMPESMTGFPNYNEDWLGATASTELWNQMAISQSNVYSSHSTNAFMPPTPSTPISPGSYSHPLLQQWPAPSSTYQQEFDFNGQATTHGADPSQWKQSQPRLVHTLTDTMCSVSGSRALPTAYANQSGHGRQWSWDGSVPRAQDAASPSRRHRYYSDPMTN